jgi:hypothetical protein
MLLSVDWLFYAICMYVLAFVCGIFSLFLRFFLELSARNYLDAFIHARLFIKAVREAEIAGFLICNNGHRGQRVVAATILAVGTGMAHSY